MPVPETLLATRKPLSLAAPPVDPGGVWVWKFVEYAQYQVLSEWCWAATGCAVYEFFMREYFPVPPGTLPPGIVQCNVATTCLHASGAGKCCEIYDPGVGRTLANLVPYIDGPYQGPLRYSPPGNPPCNSGGSPLWALGFSQWLKTTLVGYQDPGLGGDGVGLNEKQMQAVLSFLKSSQPLVIGIWNHSSELNPYGQGHALTLYGSYTANGVRHYVLADPWDGFRTATAMPEGWWWRWSYFAQPPSGS